MIQRNVVILFVLFGVTLDRAHAQDTDRAAQDEEDVRAASKAYVESFNSGDAEAVASAWSPDAVYVNRITGEQVVGREAIADQFNSVRAATSDMRLEVDIESVQFVSPNVAVEHGSARLLSPDAEPDTFHYSAVYVRHGGKWLLDRVTDEVSSEVASNYEHLIELEWMIGSWVDEDDAGQIVTDCTWTKNQNFILRSFMVSMDDEIQISGMQLIGWDAAAQQIRSWTFDSDGGFAEATWSRDEDRWYIRKKGTMADGSKATAINVVTYVDDDTYTLRSIQRSHAGKPLPNIDEVVVVRR